MISQKEFRNLPVIPDLGSVKGWKEIPINTRGREHREELVPLGPFTEYPFLQDSIYFGERISSPYKELKGSLITPFVREGVAERIKRASELLPEGFEFLIWDSYRPLEVQKALFDYYVHRIREELKVSESRAIEGAQKFVSIPSTDPTCPSPHNTGAVVDLTIVRFTEGVRQELKELNQELKSKNWHDVFKAEMHRLQLLREEGILLDMGTVFDELSSKTAMLYFEAENKKRELAPAEKECLRNRRLLYYVMSQAGFSSYEEEWWHFSFGDQFWAVKRGIPAKYGAAVFSQANMEWEKMKRDQAKGCLIMYRGKEGSAAKLGSSPTFEFVREITKVTGDPRFSIHPEAATL